MALTPNAPAPPVGLQRRPPTGPSDPPTAVTGRAVLYLRVSTKSQVTTDYDPEGLSIPAQRLACQRKAEQLGLSIVDEFIEPGKTATSMDKRPAFQAMLSRIKQQRDVDFVVVYKLSRMNRNRIDDALVMMSLRQFGVTLVSATEHIDSTPVGQLMHGILATINEFRSAEDGADIRYKMGEKARRGGTLGQAPLGYLNVREQFEGREVRSVIVDPERGPLITQAFELYATGRYTLTGLRNELTKRGLVTRGTARRPVGPVSIEKLRLMLRHRYYLGKVEYEGQEYEGRHPALVTPEVFAKVLQVLDAKATAGERQRKHHHYLKGSVWCGDCHDRGRESRVIVQRAVGRQGKTYWYFFCRGRQQHTCELPYLSWDSVEEAVARAYARIRITPEFAQRVRATVRQALADEQQAADLMRRHLKAELRKLDAREERLLDLAEDGGLPRDKLRARLDKLTAEQTRLTAELAKVESGLEAGAEAIELALCLLADPQCLYERLDDAQRRLLNQAFFDKLYIDVDGVSGVCLTEPIGPLVAAQEALNADGATDPGCAAEGLSYGAGLLVTALGGGSSKPALVEVSGFEPPTSTLRM